MKHFLRKLQQQFPNDFGQFHSELFKRAFDAESQVDIDQKSTKEVPLKRTLSTLGILHS